MSHLRDCVVAVTGASTGIGKAIARASASAGAHLALCARSAERLEATADELRSSGAEVLSLPADVTDAAAVGAFFSQIQSRFGRLDVLVNNAGAFDGGPVEEISLSAWNNVIATCLTGTFLCTQEAFRLMKPQGGGRILNIGSISGQRAREQSVPYTTAKFGIAGLTQASALDGRPHGIVCSCLHPGNVMVERREDSDLEADREPMIDVESIARAAVAMIDMPAEVNFLEAVVLPRDQLYLGRG